VSIGISKRALFEDYYVDEIGEVLYEYNEMHDYSKHAKTAKQVGGLEFFGSGGGFL
jgi:hypothetical protein